MNVKIPDYQILQRLGRGGNADVYLAIQECLKREVALKVLRDIDDDAEARSRFQHEGESIANLAHNHIVTVYDMGVKNDKYYIAMEHLSDGTLKERIQDQTCTLAQKINIITQISAALAYAHQKRYVHRDVKPANILFHADGRAILTDFGITKLLHEGPSFTLTGSQALMGTCQYMSPEQANENKHIDTRSDIYSLGIVFFEMLTGSLPYQSESIFGYCYQHNKAPIPILPAPWQSFQAIINKALAKHPDQRYQTTEDFIQDILSITETNNLVADSPPKPVIADSMYFDNADASPQMASNQRSVSLDVNEFDDPSPPAKSKTRFLLGYGGILAVVALIGIGYGLMPSDPTPEQTALQSLTRPINPTETKNDIVDELKTSQARPTYSTAQLLSQAKTFVKTRQYKNAAERYQSVLTRDPGNTQAQQALKTMADQLVVLANQALSKNDFQLSLQYIDEGLSISPKHRLLNKLKQILIARASE